MEKDELIQLIQSLCFYNNILLLHQEELVRSYKKKEDSLTNFAYICAHDLKEPLRNISLFVQLLEECTRENRDVMAEEYMQYILHNTKHMHGLINAIMERVVN